MKRVTLAEAIAEHRCICEGCPSCRAEEGKPCGQGAISLGETRCSHCRPWKPWAS